MTKIYKIVSQCKKVLYLVRVRNSDKYFDELCIDLTKATDVQKLLDYQKEDLIPLQKTYYVYV